MNRIIKAGPGQMRRVLVCGTNYAANNIRKHCKNCGRNVNIPFVLWYLQANLTVPARSELAYPSATYELGRQRAHDPSPMALRKASCCAGAALPEI
jgi:hypothetical protein